MLPWALQDLMSLKMFSLPTRNKTNREKKKRRVKKNQILTATLKKSDDELNREGPKFSVQLWQKTAMDVHAFSQ